MLRRSQVQADHVGSLVFKIRIVARHVAFQAMGTDIGLSQNALHRVLADSEATRQLTARPMGGTVVRAILDRRQYPSLQLGCSYGRLLARMPLLPQPCDTMREIAPSNARLSEPWYPKPPGSSGKGRPRSAATSCALITSPAGRLRDCAICCGSCLSSSLTTIAAALNGTLMRRSTLAKCYSDTGH